METLPMLLLAVLQFQLVLEVVAVLLVFQLVLV
jgi:hypothetical protein